MFCQDAVLGIVIVKNQLALVDRYSSTLEAERGYISRKR
jgi:hypothetical protein